MSQLTSQPYSAVMQQKLWAHALCMCLQGAHHGVRSVVIRFPRYVYGNSGSTFTKYQDGKAQELQYAGYVDAGGHRQLRLQDFS